MNPEKLQKYITEGRTSKMTDTQIRAQLLAGGWDIADIDKALDAPPEGQQKSRKKDAKNFDYTLKEPVFLPTFLGIFVTLLILCNIVLYFGQITASPTATPVSNLELLGGVLMSLIGGIILAPIYIGIKKLYHKIRK